MAAGPSGSARWRLSRATAFPHPAGRLMVNAVAASMAQVAHDLDRLDARWALVGGFAVSARAQPRFTRDVDIAVLVDDDHGAEAVVRAMVGLGYSVALMVEHDNQQRLATVRLVSPMPGGVLVDLLFASSGVEAEVVEGAESLEILPGLVMPVASPGHLVVLKLLARDDQSRPQDALDLTALRPALTSADEHQARRLAVLAMERGFHRDRDLPALVESYLRGT